MTMYTVALPVCTPPDTHGKSSEDAIPGTFSGIITTVLTSVYTFQSLAPYHPLEVISLHDRSSRCASKGLSVTRRSTSSLGRISYITRLSPVLPAESILVAQPKASRSNVWVANSVLQSFLQLAKNSPNLPTLHRFLSWGPFRIFFFKRLHTCMHELYVCVCAILGNATLS